jgi:transketolase
MASLREEFAQTVTTIGAEDDRLVVVVGDISHGILKPFYDAYPDRYHNIGILEPTMISLVAGMAAEGKIPVVHTIAPFMIERAFEQIKLDFCYHNLGGNIVTVGSAFDYSNLGCTHHCYDDFALLKNLPNTQIFYPAGLGEFAQQFRENYDNGCLNVYRLTSYPHSLTQDLVSQTGGVHQVTSGEHLTIVAVGSIVNQACDAAQRLSANGIDASVFYVNKVHPTDLSPVINHAKRTGNVIVVEEHGRFGGFAESLMMELFSVNNISFRSLNISNFIHGYGSYNDLCKEAGLDSESIAQSAMEMLEVIEPNA